MNLVDDIIQKDITAFYGVKNHQILRSTKSKTTEALRRCPLLPPPEYRPRWQERIANTHEKGRGHQQGELSYQSSSSIFA